jgi:hypothetical protein
MKNTVFWDITTCSPLKANRHFGEIYRLHFQARIYRASFQLEIRWKADRFLRWHLARFMQSWRWIYFPPKRRFTFSGLHGVISQKIELFITIAVRTSNPTNYGMIPLCVCVCVCVCVWLILGRCQYLHQGWTNFISEGRGCKWYFVGPETRHHNILK